MQLIRRFIQVFVPAALLLAVASCIGDDFAEAEAGQAEETLAEGGVYYMAFRIDTGEAGASGSRADSGDLTDAGTHESGEHAIGAGGNFAFFFDKNNKLLNISLLTIADPTLKEDENHEDPMNPDANPPANPPADNIEARYVAVITPSPVKKKDTPASVLLVVNGQRVYDAIMKEFPDPEKSNYMMDAVLKAVWTESEDPTRIGRNDKGLFTMSNAVYIEGNEVFAAVPIKADMVHEVETIYDVIPDSKELKDDEILTIRVERMVSKFSLTIADNVADPISNAGKNTYVFTPAIKPEDLSQNDKIDLCVGWTNIYKEDDTSKEIIISDWEPVIESTPWKAEFLGWGMNALETESHLFKHIENKTYFIAWNDQDNYRSYWSEDPHYQKDYAWQYRWAVNRNLNWYADDKNDADWTNLLVNYPWKDSGLNNQPDGKDVIYTPENTYDSEFLQDRLDGRTELLAGTHLIVRANLWIDENSIDKDLEAGKEKSLVSPVVVENRTGVDGYKIVTKLYRDRIGVWYTSARDCLWGLVRAFNNALASQTKMRYRYYDWNSPAKTDDEEVLYAVPTVTYDNGDTEKTEYFKLYYGDNLVTYDYIKKLTEDQCEKLLADAYIKDGDGKRMLDTSGFSVKKKNNEGDLIPLPIYSQYNVGVDESKKDRPRYDNSPYKKDRTPAEMANDIKSLFYEWAGAVDLFQAGMMYYPYAVEIKKEAVYGAVRNAWYRFEVEGIDNIGVPVHDETMPIVPNWDSPFDQINVKVNILGWHRIGYDIPLNPSF